MTSFDALHVLTSERSGALGDIIASRNSHGQYYRPRSGVTQPNTPDQIAARAAFSTAKNRWRLLTPALRARWAAYASVVLFPNRWGMPQQLAPDVMFLKLCLPRLFLGQPALLQPPRVFHIPTFQLPLISPNASSFPDVTGTVANEPWLNTDGNIMTFSVGRTQPNTIGFYAGPYIMAGFKAGDSTAPPPLTLAFNSPYGVTFPGQLPIRIRISMADGRLSSPKRLLVPVNP